MKDNTSLFDFTTDKNTIKKSALNSVLIQLLFKLKGVITMPIITYYLLPSELGVFNLINVTAAMLTPLFIMNLADGPAIYLVQEKSRERIVVMYNTVINASLLFSLAFAVIMLLMVSLFVREYDRYAIITLALIFSTLGYKLVSYILAVFQKTDFFVHNTIIKDASVTVLSIVFVIIGYSFSGLIYAAVIGNIIAAVLVLRFTKSELPYKAIIDWSVLKQFLNTSIPLLPVFFFSWIIQSSDSYFLAFFKGEAEVGKYSIIYGITNVILSLTYALNFFWFPISARLWIENREQYRCGFVFVFAGFTTLLLAAVVAFELNAKFVMRLFVRSTEYHDAYVIMGLIAFAFAMQVLLTLLTAPLYSNRNNKTILICYLSGGIVNTIMNLLLIPATGIVGAAVSTAVSYLIIVVIMAYCNYLMAGFSFVDSRLKYVIGIFAVAWPGLLWLREILPLYSVIIVDLLLFPTTGALLYFKVLTDAERHYLVTAFVELRQKQEMKA